MPESAGYKRFFEVVSRMTGTLQTGADLEETLQAMVEAVSGVYGAKGGILRFLDPAGAETGILASTGLSRSLLEQGAGIADSSLPELYEDRLVIIQDAANDSRVSEPEQVLREGISSIIGIPFQAAQDTRMVLWLFFENPQSFDIEDASILYYTAVQCAASARNSILQTRYLETFSKVSAAIHEGQETREILNSIVTNIQDITSARGCIYWIVDTSGRQIHMKATSGFQMESLSAVSYETLKEVFRFHEEKDVFFEDVREDPRIPSTTTLGKQMVTSILGIPFSIVDQYKGILAVYFSQARSLMQLEIEFVRALGRQGAIALHKAFRYDERMLKAFRETIEGLALALEAKDVCTHGHSLNVANYSYLAARQMNLSEQEAETIYHAGLLHDIGKIAMQDNILDNLGNLQPDDFEIVKKHPVIGARIIGPLSFLADAAQLILYHHERYDGSGYPEGLTGEAIPLGARIIAVSDCFDAMTSQRLGTETVGVKKALGRLKEQSGTSFDPEVVRAFVKAIEENPDEVRPFNMPEDYFTRHSETFKAHEKKRSPLAQMLRKCVPGF